MTQRTERFPKALLAPLLALVAGLAAAQAGPDVASVDLPVTRLVLFTSGVGYFEREGVVSGEQELVLNVPRAEMDDLLQSLVLQDLDGGRVTPVRYTSQAPLGRLLEGYSLDLRGDVTLPSLLAQARGEQVVLEGATPLTGALLGVEEQRTAEGEPRAFVTLATAEGVRRVPLAEVSAVRFADPALNAELAAALATIAAHRDAHSATVRLRFEGEGERRVRVGYVREMPVWKSSYRLVLGEAGAATLQGWAIVDNPTDEELVDVQLSFVAGQPVSFVTSLYEPVWAQRPRVATEATGGVVPDLDPGRFLAAPAPAMEATMDAAARAAPQLSGAGVAAQAQGATTGVSFAYHVTDPVTIGRHESTLVPIVVTEVEARSLSLYQAGTSTTHPFHAVRLVNDTGLHLAAGTVTLFDAGGFAGNARLPDLLPGDDRLLAYALDLGLGVSVEGESEPTRVAAVALRGATLETTLLSRLVTRVNVAVHGDEGRFLVVELPAQGGYQVAAPAPRPPAAGERLRFGVAVVGADGAVPDDPGVPTHLVCRPGGACVLEVVLERLDSRSVAVANVAASDLAFYLENVELSAQDRATLERVVALQRELAAAERAVEATQARIDAIFREQERVRANLATLPRDSDLYRRYVADLDAQEDELVALRAELEERRAAHDELRRRLDELVAGIGR